MIKVVKKASVISALLAVVFMAFQVLADLYLPNMTSNIIDNGVAKGDIDYIWRIGGIMMVISVISIIAAFGNAFFATRESQRLGRKLRSEIYEKAENFSINKFGNYGAASLITRTTNDVEQVQRVMQMFLRLMIQAPIMLLGASFLAYQKDAQLTKVFLVVIPLVIIAVGGIMYFAVPLFRSMQKKTDRINLIFREELTGVRVIRAFNKENHETDRFDQANRDFTHTAIKVNTIVAFMMPLMTLIMSGTNIGITWFGGQYIADMQLQVGNMIAFITYAMQILISFMMLSMIFVMVPRAQASADRINEVLEETPDITDKKQPEEIFLSKEEATLTFDQVNFRYADADSLALEDVNFKAKAGQTVAIIGGTGSGKTTFANLLPRLHEVSSGTICLNGHDIRNIRQHDLRELIGFVPQTAVLFRGTIRENMRYGNAKASEEQIWQALKIAQAQDFVEEMPDGLDSHVEQGGGNFSGGQRQRLAIARALIKAADLYVFDDSFSALDFKTDANLRQALQQEIQSAIKVIVAQRVSTIMDADIILVLEAGKVVGKGTHKELLDNNKTYQEIAYSQLREEDLK